MLINKSEKQKGILALIALSLVFACMGLFIRYLATSFTVLQQVYLRVFAAFLLSLIFFSNSVDYRKLAKIKGPEWCLLVFRAITWYGFGVTLLSMAILTTKFSNASFIAALPLTALFGFMILKEKISLGKVIFIILAFVGAAIVGIQNFTNIFVWGAGDLLALLASISFSLAYVTRNFHSKLLSNREITIILFGIAFIFLFLTSLMLDRSLPISNWGVEVVAVILLAGLFNVANIFLTNYGFQKVEAVLASNLLTLEFVFAIILGFIFFQEVSTFKELVGGAIIVASVIGMGYLEKSSKKN